MSTLLSTSHIAAGERAAYWIDMICDVFVQLDCTQTGERFHGEIADRTIGPLRVSRVDSNKQLVLRSSRQIARSCEDYFLVSLQLAGHGRVLQDGRAALLGPGDFALYDSTRRYTLAFDDEFTQIVLKTPRALLTDRLARQRPALRSPSKAAPAWAAWQRSCCAALLVRRTRCSRTKSNAWPTL